ncbi:MAG: polyprenyl synthetase family protein [Prevotellaceae bacterium]|nr:polyprenyl synthetase family protein [Prevotellaceae bacterium]
MYNASEVLEKVNGYLARRPFDRQPASLYEPVKYVLSIGGKRVRPVLMLMAYNLFKDDVDSILSSALALETYHNYTLLHDDLMDDSDVRRGFPTVHKKWDANTAILSGDAMQVCAFLMMQENPTNLKEVLRLFSVTALEIGEGQQYDMDFETRSDVTEEEYIEMIRLKTSVLLACAMKIGGLLAEAPQADLINLYKFGEKTGLAFQLQDDYLDVYGDPKVFRKNLGGDIVSNKKTYMLINALNRANTSQRAELDKWISAKDFDREEKIAAVTKLYDEIGIRELSEQKVNAYFEESQRYLNAIGVADEKKNELRTFTAQLMNRAY